MIIDDIALTLEEGVSPRVAAYLIDCFGSAEAIYRASEQQLIEQAELKPQLAAQLVRKSKHKLSENEVKHMVKYGITAIESTSSLYPRLLKECCDYPHVLYVKGDPAVLGSTMLTMVGTRNVTGYGAKMCDSLVQSLADVFPDLVVVSGLAYGVDVACHRAALRCGLRTIGVVVNCLPAISPTHHASIAEDMIRQGGAVVSEINSCCKEHKGQFLRRNRIIAGLSAGTVIVESQKSGGSLITASMADGYNRVVMAVPGRVGDDASEGTNALIKMMKARMVTCGADIASELGWEIAPKLEEGDLNDVLTLSPEQRVLYDCFASGEVYSVDDLVQKSGLPINMLLSLLLEMEFDGIIRGLPGGRYEKFS